MFVFIRDAIFVSQALFTRNNIHLYDRAVWLLICKLHCSYSLFVGPLSLNSIDNVCQRFVKKMIKKGQWLLQ